MKSLQALLSRYGNAAPSAVTPDRKLLGMGVSPYDRYEALTDWQQQEGVELNDEEWDRAQLRARTVGSLAKVLAAAKRRAAGDGIGVTSTRGPTMSTKQAADVSDFRLAFPEAAGREADFVEGFLKRAHEICGHSIEGTPDLPQALLSIAIAEKLASTPDFLTGFTKQLAAVGAPSA